MKLKKLLAHLALIGATFSVLLYIMQDCGREESSLNDIATNSSLKTGFFMPGLEKMQIQAMANVNRIGNVDELAERLGVTLDRSARDARFAVATTAESENILITERAGLMPGPVASLDRSGKVYEWGNLMVSNDATNTVSDLFIRYERGAEPQRSVSADGNQSNMYFVRFPLTREGHRQPMLINYVDHIQTSSGHLLYRVGGTIFLAGSDASVLRYSPITTNVWMAEGSYSDPDISNGTVFWTEDNTVFYSLKPGAQMVNKWTKQDKDSFDRDGEIAKNSAKVPPIVETVLANGVSLSLASTSNKKPVIFGFDSLRLDSSAITMFPAESQFRLAKFESNRGDASQLALTDQESEGFALNGRGPQTGLPVFDPRQSYPPGVRVQIEYPAGSGIYREGLVKRPSYRTTTTADGWLWDTEQTTIHTDIALAHVDASGRKTWRGEIAKLSSMNGEITDRVFTTQEIDEQEVAVQSERLEQENAALQQRFAEQTQTADSAMVAAEAAAERLSAAAIAERAVTAATIGQVDKYVPGSNSLSTAREIATQTLSNATAREIAATGVRFATDTVQGNDPTSRVGLDVSLVNIAGGAVTAAATSSYNAGRRSIIQPQFRQQPVDSDASRVPQLAAKRAIDGGTQNQFARQAVGRESSRVAVAALNGADVPVSVDAINFASDAASVTNGLVWNSINASTGGAFTPLIRVGEFGSQTVIDEVTSIGMSRNAVRLYNQANQTATQLSNLRVQGGNEAVTFTREARDSVGQDWEAFGRSLSSGPARR